MTEGTEQAIEQFAGGILFCMAIAMLLWFHTVTEEQLRVFGKEPERLILFEQGKE